MKAANDKLSVQIRALSEPSRRRILELLSGPKIELSSNDLIKKLKLAQPTLSHHVKVLRNAGFIDEHKVGTFVYLSRRKGVVNDVAAKIAKISKLHAGLIG